MSNNVQPSAAKSHPGQHRFTLLIIALLVIGVGAPILEMALGGPGALLTEVAVAVSLLAALWSVGTTRRGFQIAMALLAVNVVATVVWLLADGVWAAPIAHTAGFFFLTILAVAAVRAILEPGPVTLDKMIGGLCVYLLIGIGWGELYQLLFSFDQNAFSGIGEQTGHFLSWRLNYFSFVTLTTLGYGDVLPVTALAQSITIIETLVGQLYLAVLVASLVSGYFEGKG
ncbi:MAG: potassium channel family protein [Gammaproteobacteria bacterium]